MIDYFLGMIFGFALGAWLVMILWEKADRRRDRESSRCRIVEEYWNFVFAERERCYQHFQEIMTGIRSHGYLCGMQELATRTPEPNHE